MPARAFRSRLIATATLLVAGTFVLAANGAAGIEPNLPAPISESAFRPVSVPAPSTGVFTAPRSIVAVPVIQDPWLATPPPGRAQPSIAAAKPIVVPVRPKTTHAISGPASYYCRAGISPCTADYPDRAGFQAYAAAGPRLRAAMGPSWRGRIVYVDGIRVQLIDWCQCYQGESNEKLLDLYYDVHARTGTSVTVRW